jgi:prophage DNA circulation protein
VRTCAELLRTFARLAPRLESELDIATFDRALDAALPAVIQHAEVPSLQDALDELVDALEETGHDASRVREVRRLLAESTRRLLPKPSDEPDAAHPR